jgi:uncharacterized protein (DUF433 family)
MNVDRITRDPNRLGGQPCIRDLRITVRRALQAIALYPDRDEHQCQVRSSAVTVR